MRQALPAGYRNNSDGAFYNLGTNANYWSATENSGTNAWNRNLNSTESRSNRNNNNKTNGFSVRCLQDWFKMGGVLTPLIFLIREEKG